MGATRVKQAPTYDNRSTFRRLLDWYMYSSLHIGLCAGSLTAFSISMNDDKGQQSYIYWVICSTIAVYSLHRIIGIKKVDDNSHGSRFNVIRKYRNHIFIYFILASIGSLYYMFLIPNTIIFSGVLSGVVSLLYVLPVFSGKRLRDFNYVKIFLIAIIWSLVCVFNPFLLGNNMLGGLGWSAVCILFFVGLTLPFDIRDVEVDTLSKVRTLATRKSYKEILTVARLCILLSAVFCWFVAMSTPAGLSWSIVCFSTMLLLRSDWMSLDDWFFSLVLDGMIGLFFPIYLIIHMIL